MLMVLVEAAVAGDWVGLMAFDKKQGQGTHFREVKERQIINMRESKGRLMENAREKPADDVRETVESEGLQCLQEELLLCTDQLTSTLKRYKISISSRYQNVNHGCEQNSLK